MMRYILSLFFPVILWSIAAGQVQQVNVGDETALQETLEKALLWKIEGDHVSGSSYIFGTIHLISADEFFMPPGTELALEAVQRVVFEIDMAEMMDLGAQISMFAKAFMKNGVRLKDLVSEEDYLLVKNHFQEIGIPLFLLERIKPMFLSVFATGDFSAEDFQSGGTTSYEMEFYQIATDRDIPTGGLETMEFQLAVFDSIPYEDQAQMLVESIRFEDEGNEQFEEMMRLYKEQDIDGLHAITTAPDSDLGEYEDMLLDDRNANWIAGITQYMSEGPVFFAVGAAHLGGPTGVIRLLRAEGYQVTPVLSDSQPRPVKRF